MQTNGFACPQVFASPVKRFARCFALAVGLTLPAAAQTTWFVDVNATPPGDGSAGNPYTSIQFAIDQPGTLNGDTILVLPGTYFEHIDFGSKDLELMSEQGPDVTILDGSSSGRVVTVGGQAGGGIRGFTIQNGNETGGGFGGGIYAFSGSTVDIENCRVRLNDATFGGGIACTSFGSVVITNTFVEDNRSLPDTPNQLAGAGGGLYLSNNALIDGCSIQRNTATGSGGGIWSWGSLDLRNSTIGENVVIDPFFLAQSGAGCWAAGSLDMTNCAVIQNEISGSSARGGGVASFASGVIRDCLISGNSVNLNQFFVGDGGGLYGGDVVEDTVFSGNRANGKGGGNASGDVFRRCTFDSNSARMGGGAYGLTLAEECRFTNNGGIGITTPNFGAGVHSASMLVDCELDNNAITGEGGGAHSSTLVRCLIRANQAVATANGMGGLGGGAVNCTLTDCEVRNNQADNPSDPSGMAFGGGLHSSTATGCEIWGNQATSVAGGSSALGGGAYASDLTRCALYDNVALEGAGAWGGSLEHCTVYANAGEGVRSASSVHNSILRANLVQLIASPATYCNIEGMGVGLGNIDAPEVFWMPTPGPDGSRDLHFASGTSPGVDAGDPASPLDPDGTRADMGAYPWDPSYCPTPKNYCVGKPSLTLSCLSSIASTGSPTLSGADDFHVTANGVLGSRPGLFFWGLQPAALPFLGGTLCVAPPLRRTGVQFSGGGIGTCNGSFDYFFTQAAMAADGIVPFVQIYGQYWNRDPADPFGSALSDGLYWTTCP